MSIAAQLLEREGIDPDAINVVIFAFEGPLDYDARVLLGRFAGTLPKGTPVLKETPESPV
jgi:hypothetical protein